MSAVIEHAKRDYRRAPDMSYALSGVDLFHGKSWLDESGRETK